MPLPHAEDGSETKLPTQIKVDKLEYFLYGYDPYLRQKHLVLRLIPPFAEKTAKSQKTIEVLWKTHRLLRKKFRKKF